MANFETFKLVDGETLYLTGATLNDMAAKEKNFELLDSRGYFVENERFYKVTAEGIEEVE